MPWKKRSESKFRQFYPKRCLNFDNFTHKSAETVLKIDKNLLNISIGLSVWQPPGQVVECNGLFCFVHCLQGLSETMASHFVATEKETRLLWDFHDS